MIAADPATVSELNSRARADRVAAGTRRRRRPHASPAGRPPASATRSSPARTTASSPPAAGGSRTGTAGPSPPPTDDGTMTVRRAGGHGEVVLPADYVADHVELGYASTAHRAQGRTVDTAHALVSPDHHPRSALRVRHPRPGSQPALRRHPLRPRPADRTRRRQRARGPPETCSTACWPTPAPTLRPRDDSRRRTTTPSRDPPSTPSTRPWPKPPKPTAGRPSSTAAA